MRNILFKSSSNSIGVIKKSLKGCLANTTIFPEHVKTIAGVGVARYEVDLINHKVAYYLKDGTVHTESLPLIDSQSNAQLFSEVEVKSAITEIQKQSIDYPTFLKRIVSAGTKEYEVNIDRGKITYQGEHDNYVENFPKLD